MLTVGLTGGIGSGKTTVSDIFDKLGIPVIDTDIISRELVENDRTVLKEILEIFGDSIISENGTLDRKKLAQIVFNDKKARQQLEDILHPKIRTEVNKLIQTYISKSPSPRYIIIVIPLLFETDFRDLVDRIIVITSDESLKIERVMRRDHRDADEIRSIIDNQTSDETRVSGADDVINNNSNLKQLESQILGLHRKYTDLPETAR